MTECRVMETRTCPKSYGGPCGDRPCARFESDDPAPWSRADYRCGRCGDTFTATTEADYLVITAHRTAHELVDASTPELRAKLIGLALAEIETGLTD